MLSEDYLPVAFLPVKSYKIIYKYLI